MRKSLKFSEFYRASASARKIKLRGYCKELQVLFGMEWRQASGYALVRPINGLVGMTKDLNRPSQRVGAWPIWLLGGTEDSNWIKILIRIITQQ